MYKVIKRLYSGRHLVGFEVVDLDSGKVSRLQTGNIIKAIQSGKMANAIFKDNKVIVGDTNLGRVNIKNGIKHKILPIITQCIVNVQIHEMIRSEMNGALYFRVKITCDNEQGYEEVAIAIKMYSENDSIKHRIYDCCGEGLHTKIRVADLLEYSLANNNKIRAYMNRSDVNELIKEDEIVKFIKTVGIQFV